MIIQFEFRYLAEYTNHGWNFSAISCERLLAFPFFQATPVHRLESYYGPGHINKMDR